MPALLLGAWWLRRRHTWTRNSGLLVAGVLLFAVPLLLFNARVYGSPLGPHMANNRLGSAGSIGKLLLDPSEWGPGALYTLIGWGNTNPAFTWQLKAWLANPWPQFQHEIKASLWMSVPLLGWLVLGITGGWRRWWPVTLVVELGLIANSVWLLHDPDAPEQPDRRPLQAVILITLFYTVVNLLKPTLGGTEWGSRHLLSVYPALLVLGWSALEPLLPAKSGDRWRPEARPLLGAVGVLTLLSALILGHGLMVVRGMHENNRDLADALEKIPDEVVVCSSWWAPMNAAPAYYRKKLLFAGDPEHPAPPLFQRMARQGVQSYTLVGYGPWDLSNFAAPAGYMPVTGANQQVPLGLVTNRFTLVGEMPPAAPEPPAPETPAPGAGGELPPSMDIRPGAPRSGQ
ncbi:MAG: hypothetical protein K0Q72_5402 [Armatimonadetes bacterium]|nr:hypothetical protein [Armatimonadota bacterium]